MRKYNLFILIPHLIEKEAEQVAGMVSEMIKKVGGEVEKVEQYGKRKLSYAVKKARHGFYLTYLLNLPTDKIEKIIQELKLKPEILRFELSQYRERKKEIKKKKDIRDIKDINKIVRSEAEENKISEKRVKAKISLEELDKKLDNILGTESV